MTIWISRELSFFNFKRPVMLCAWIGHPSEKLWPFEFLECFRCSILSISIYYVPESDLRVKIYDHLKFSRAMVVQFRASRYVMRLNRTSEWKVMTTGISRELSLFNFERLDMLCTWIGHPSEKLWPFKFLWISRELPLFYSERLVMLCAWIGHPIMPLNQTSILKVVTIWIPWEHPFFNFERLNMWCAWSGHSCEKLWPFKFLEIFRCSISSVLIY